MNIYSYNMSVLSFGSLQKDDFLYYYNDVKLFNYIFDKTIRSFKLFTDSNSASNIDIDLALFNINNEEDFDYINDFISQRNCNYIVLFYNRNFVNYDFQSLSNSDYILNKYKLRTCQFKCPIKGFTHFVIYARKGYPKLDFEKNENECVTLNDILDDHPLNDEWHYTHRRSNKYDLIKNLPQGGELENGFIGSFYRAEIDGLIRKLNHLSLHPYRLIHPLKNRSFTPYELMKILNVKRMPPLYLKSCRKQLMDILKKTICDDIMDLIFSNVRVFCFGYTICDLKVLNRRFDYV